ncbi:PAS domain-containing protein [Alkalicoccus daliensis]|uniref:PAS domain S-box-containing protein n=1 Tax=Alkalicoccus daliensis TaxID=745820 RepID=A0A1H0HIB6_9BACI|nr:PAS domain-containing protein [Alkalicoccus daliensis]SDO18857.1 PAS domain S-box-containing protein [Alkalicoccus daliensis]
MYKAALELIDESILITDSKLIIQYINTCYENTFKLEREEVVGKHLHDVFSHLKDNQKVLSRTLEIGGNSKFKNVPLSWKGKDYILDIDTRLEHDAEGEVEHIVTRLRDITEQVMERKEMVEVINNLTVNIIRLNDTTGVLPLQPISYESQYEQLIHETTQQSLQLKLEVLIIDLSSISKVDDRFVSIISNSFQALTLLGIRVVFSGVHPNLAKGLQPFIREMKNYPSYSNLRAALKSL